MRCPQCGKATADAAQFCVHCGAALPEGPAGPAQPAAVETSGKAIASLVLGIGGLCCGISAILGLIFGILALGEIDRSGGRLGGRGLAIAGIIVSVLMLILSVLGAIMILSARGLPMR